MHKKIMLTFLAMTLSACGTVNTFFDELLNGITVSVNVRGAVTGMTTRLEVYENDNLYTFKEGRVPGEFRLSLPPTNPSLVVTGFKGEVPIYLSQIKSLRAGGTYRVLFDETMRLQVDGKLEFIRYAGPDAGEILLYVDNNIGFEPLSLAAAPTYPGFYLAAIVPFSSASLAGGIPIRFPSAGQLRVVVLAGQDTPREYTFQYNARWLSANPYTFTFIWQ